MESSLSCCSFACCLKEKKALDERVSQNMLGPVYNRIAPIYDFWGKLMESHARNRSIALADIKGGQAILEVAVGTGLALYEIVKKNPTGINMTEGKRLGSRAYGYTYNISPKRLDGMMPIILPAQRMVKTLTGRIGGIRA